MTGKVIFFFSFRSPYSWLATHRLAGIINELPVDFEFMPVFPIKGRKTAAEKNPRKLLYIGNDVRRFANAYGLALNFPQPFDINWLPPNAAFLYASENQKPFEFSLAMHMARFCHGDDISDTGVIGRIAGESGLDPAETISAAGSEAYQQALQNALQESDKRRIFGVPTFIYNDNMYWGNDRLEWLIRDIMQEHGEVVPDLISDPLTRPW